MVIKYYTICLKILLKNYTISTKIDTMSKLCQNQLDIPLVDCYNSQVMTARAGGARAILKMGLHAVLFCGFGFEAYFVFEFGVYNHFCQKIIRKGRQKA